MRAVYSADVAALKAVVSRWVGAALGRASGVERDQYRTGAAMDAAMKRAIDSKQHKTGLQAAHLLLARTKCVNIGCCLQMVDRTLRRRQYGLQAVLVHQWRSKARAYRERIAGAAPTQHHSAWGYPLKAYLAGEVLAELRRARKEVHSSTFGT